MYSIDATTRSKDASGTIDSDTKNEEALLTAFWSIVWPGLERIGWKRIVGEGNDEGSMLFLPFNIENSRLGKRNIDYYDKIRFVIKRLEERRNTEEGKILDLFRDEVRTVNRDILVSRPKRGPGRPRLGVSRPSKKVREIDTSWKDKRCLYPKTSSQVGAECQVSFLPLAGTIETEKHLDKSKYDIIWNPKKAAETGMLSFIEDYVPQNKREKAMQLLHDKNYSVVKTTDFINQIDQSNVSSWSSNDIKKFHAEIFRCRKNFKALSQSMGNKEMGDIIAYYLGHYKKSEDYRLLKTVRMEERIEKAQQPNHDADHCVICGEGGNLLICDGCESEWHMECTKPALKTVPEGHWECDVCIDRKFLEARKRILQDMKSNASSVRKLEKIKELELPHRADIRTDGSEETEIGTHFNTIEAIKAFSRNIDSILTKPSIASKPEQVQQLI